jgi:hypothetical protein
MNSCAVVLARPCAWEPSAGMPKRIGQRIELSSAQCKSSFRNMACPLFLMSIWRSVCTTLHTASYGLIGYTMKIIRGAARIARYHPHRQVTMRTLSQSFVEHVWAERLNDPNPFTENFDCDKAPPLTLPSASPYVPNAAGRNRRVRVELHA